MHIPDISHWLQTTPASEWLQNTIWAIPTLQTLHILGICVVMSSVTVLTLRLLGVLGRTWPLSEVIRRFLPWVWGALLVLLLSGSLLILADPQRELSNEIFWVKMGVLTGAVSMTAVFQVIAVRAADLWSHRRLAARVTAALLLVLWMGAAVAGRWIAYFDQG